MVMLAPELIFPWYANKKPNVKKNFSAATINVIQWQFSVPVVP